MPSEIEQLPDLEGYLKASSSSWRQARIGPRSNTAAVQHDNAKCVAKAGVRDALRRARHKLDSMR
jgi:hypothetical protein